MKIIDLKKEMKPMFTASAKKVTYVDVPEMNFLMIDGKGDPNADEFQQAANAIYSVAYTLKFMLKKGPQQIDYPVMALEGLWGMQHGAAFEMGARDKWEWTLMIMKPKIITRAMVDEAKALAAKKKDLPNIDKILFKPFHEGYAAQIMHIGPYATELETVKRMDDEVRAAGYTFVGRHHEIYMGDPRRTAPERLKTILRHAVKKA